MKKYIKNVFWVSVSFAMFSVILIIIADSRIEKNSNMKVFSEIADIPYNKVGLLLGTGKYLKSGAHNPYYIYRLNAAEELFHAGKIDYLVISGDNSKTDYNEPNEMKSDLMEKGIDSSKIFLDFAGFRTFDSVYRINHIFGQKEFTVISQEFHNKRAVYIAEHLNLDAIAYNAKDVDNIKGFKTNLREKFARVKMLIDLLTNKKPKFLGESIEIK
jgi:SanA protein